MCSLRAVLQEAKQHERCCAYRNDGNGCARGREKAYPV